MKRLRETRDEAATRVPLDEDSKKAIAGLDPVLRERIGIQWRVRATAELRVAGVFAGVSQGLFERGADPKVLSIAARAVSDEVRHAALCGAVSEHYLERTAEWPVPGTSRMPKLSRAPMQLRPTLHTLAMGCVNETIASAWLEASLREATVPLARSAIRELIADDVHHARMGWAHLASGFVSRETRLALGAWLPALLEAAAKPWTLKGKLNVPEGAPDHGVPSESTTLSVARGTVYGVILPGFDALGVPTGAAREWCARTLEQ
jgi:hypothetical protein